MARALAAGIIYFAAVFAAGFALGAVRNIFLEPRIGELGAVAAELPFMLGVSWVACSRLISHFKIAQTIAARALMGASAFLLLMTAEIALSIFAFNIPFRELAANWRSPAGALGLAGQGLFGALPALCLFATRR